MSQHASFAGRQFYHGTDDYSADGILHTGSKPSRDGIWGRGFYSSDHLDVADDYAEGAYGDPTVLRGTVDVKNPKVFSDTHEVNEYLRSKGHSSMDRYLLTDVTAEDGHDGVYLSHLNYMVTPEHGSFHPNAVADGVPWGAAHDEERKTRKWTDLT